MDGLHGEQDASLHFCHNSPSGKLIESKTIQPDSQTVAMETEGHPAFLSQLSIGKADRMRDNPAGDGSQRQTTLPNW